MTKKVYRTSQGKSVDIGALQLQNETVRAVGNMGVNARGDQINSKNTTVDNRNTRIGKQYKKQVTNVTDDRVPETKHDQEKTLTKQEKRKVKSVIEERMESEADLFSVESVKPEPVVNDPVVESSTGGLADAIAKARSVKQEALKTPRQMSQERAGVKKI